MELIPMLIVIATAALTLCAAAQAQVAQLTRALLTSTGKVISPEVSAFIKDALERESIPGLSLGIVRLVEEHEPAVELGAWGRQTEDTEEDDLTPDALFALASCSKAFLTTSIGLLIHDYALGRNATPLPHGVRKLSWDTKVREVLPGEWGLRDHWAESKLNLREAFSHMSGLPRHDYSYRPGETTADVLRRLKTLSPAFELREQWMYNNQMFMMGAHLVSQLANTSYPSFVESRIFVPLNMTSSTFSPSKATQTGRLTQTWTRGLRRIPFWFSDEVATLFAGPGGVISTAEDMTKWLAVLINEGVDPLTNKIIIPHTVLMETTTARVIVNGAAAGDLSIVGYGLGWLRMSYRGHDVVWHFGAIPGFSLLVAFLPHEKLGVVILTNIDEKYNETLGILFRILDEALGLPRKPRQPSHRQDASVQDHAGVAATKSEPLPLKLDAYAGTYHDVAYGNITLCAPSSTSEHCSAVLAAFASIESAHAAPLSRSPNDTLYAAWQRVWSTHMRLRHTSANSFAVASPALFPHGFGRNTTPFEFWDSQMSVGRAEFVVEDDEVVGFALVTEEQAALARAQRAGGSLREVGDAWFVKMVQCVGTGGL